MTSPEIEANTRAQAELYGEPLGIIVRRCVQTLGVTQARMASLLGISAPMLSQLVNGHRVKIGNPAAVARLQAAYDIAGRVTRGETTSEEGLAELEREVAGGVVTHRSTEAAVLRTVLSVAGDADEYEAAALLLDADHPLIAQILRQYGGHGRG